MARMKDRFRLLLKREVARRGATVVVRQSAGDWGGGKLPLARAGEREDYDQQE